ncbi:MAG: tRNA (N6-threonylcarbamoyladenosine(37)-N6)-methyltransferase TrmO [Bacteroidales bacterium]|nr:tRNA (N6-threonylcarbamoyladenosine(37)-N6)-methyltransferase TrmO [Bacteroidales bacterium]
MKGQNITFNPIGIIHTPFDGTTKIPRQGSFKPETRCRAVLKAELAAGLKDLETFSCAFLLFYFHNKEEPLKLIQHPPMSNKPRGVFAIRSPLRPSKIGLTVVKIISVDNNVLHFSGGDMIDGTPLQDIKPYISETDSYPDAGTGWLTQD